MTGVHTAKVAIVQHQIATYNIHRKVLPWLTKRNVLEETSLTTIMTIHNSTLHSQTIPKELHSCDTTLLHISE